MWLIGLTISLFNIIKTKALECVSVVNQKCMPRPKILDVNEGIRKNIFIFACLFSVHNTISLSRRGQVCLMRLRFERYFSHNREPRLPINVASLNILVHDVINLL